ncbi:hypothetical protein [Haladaptatus sp. DYF46]|uniref:hypothetical protein n=1 Tax=Haladaptatus sp. DYF46 TaxID=2886041 RepID=UPI001E49339F|nr:hypothetical protein [Haladaptatus sp. DYF46]
MSGHCLPISPPERSRPKWMAISYTVGVGLAIAYIATPDPLSISGSGVTFAIAGGLFSGIGSTSTT